jgi:hypothetical protein
LPLPALEDHPSAGPILPPGIHTATVPEIRERLVDGIEGSMTRSRLFEDWRLFRSRLRALLAVEREFLAGSFVSGKPNPKDTDAFFWVRSADLERLEDEEAFLDLWREAGRFNCDPYVLPEWGSPFPEGSIGFRPEPPILGLGPDYRGELWTYYGGEWRGYVEVVGDDLEELPREPSGYLAFGHEESSS